MPRTILEHILIRTVLSAILLWAVMAYGSVSGWQREATAWLLASAAPLVWVAGWRSDPLWPRVSPRLWVFVFSWAVILLHGGIMTWNAAAEHSLDTWVFTVRENRPLPSLPGSVAEAASRRIWGETAALALIFFAVLTRRRTVTLRFTAGLLAFLGVAVTAVGCWHRLLELDSVWGLSEDPHPATFFAPFVYNANAAALLNLSLPAALGLALSNRARRGVGDPRRWVWLAAAALICGGLWMTASKGGQLLALLSLALFGGWNYRRLTWLMRETMGYGWRRTLEVGLLVGVVLGIFCAGLLVGLDHSSGRWQQAVDGGWQSLESRLAIAEVMLEMAKPGEGSWHGFGPGSFRHVFPYYTNDAEGTILEGRYLFGHGDLLQTAVEWGWLGAAAWAALIAASIYGGAVAIVAATAGDRDLRGQTAVLRGLILALVIVLAHAAFDFPLSLLGIQALVILICATLAGAGLASGALRKASAKTG